MSRLLLSFRIAHNAPINKRVDTGTGTRQRPTWRCGKAMMIATSPMIGRAMLRPFGTDASDKALQRPAGIIQYAHLRADDEVAAPSVAARVLAFSPLRASALRCGRIHLLWAGGPRRRWPHLSEALVPRTLLEVLTWCHWTGGPDFEQGLEGERAWA